MGNVARKQAGGAASSFPHELAIIPMLHKPYSVLVQPRSCTFLLGVGIFPVQHF